MATFPTFSEGQQTALKPGLSSRPLGEAKLAKTIVWHHFPIYLEK